MNIEIRHNPDENRFETEVEGDLCVLEYTLDGSVVSMNRVYVPPPVEGRGIAGRLTQTALDHTRQQNWTVIPRCPYVAAWIKHHPDYQNLVDQQTD